MAVAGGQGYLNGEIDGSAFYTGSNASTYGIHIGCLSGSGNPELLFTGKIQAVAIYNTVLSGAEVKEISRLIALL
jgi:hypothetical protein